MIRPEAPDDEASRLEALPLGTFRDSDVVARIGGDEFVVLVSGARGSETREAIGRLRENVDRLNSEAERRYELRFTLGAAVFDPERHESLQDLLREADRVMYEKKRSHVHEVTSRDTTGARSR